jgi:hypothetical protein
MRRAFCALRVRCHKLRTARGRCQALAGLEEGILRLTCEPIAGGLGEAVEDQAELVRGVVVEVDGAGEARAQARVAGKEAAHGLGIAGDDDAEPELGALVKTQCRLGGSAGAGKAVPVAQGVGLEQIN